MWETGQVILGLEPHSSARAGWEVHTARTPRTTHHTPHIQQQMPLQREAEGLRSKKGTGASAGPSRRCIRLQPRAGLHLKRVAQWSVVQWGQPEAGGGLQCLLGGREEASGRTRAALESSLPAGEGQGLPAQPEPAVLCSCHWAPESKGPAAWESLICREVTLRVRSREGWSGWAELSPEDSCGGQYWGSWPGIRVGTPGFPLKC